MTSELDAGLFVVQRFNDFHQLFAIGAIPQITLDRAPNHTAGIDDVTCELAAACAVLSGLLCPKIQAQRELDFCFLANFFQPFNTTTFFAKDSDYLDVFFRELFCVLLQLNELILAVRSPVGTRKQEDRSMSVFTETVRQFDGLVIEGIDFKIRCLVPDLQ